MIRTGVALICIAVGAFASAGATPEAPSPAAPPLGQSFAPDGWRSEPVQPPEGPIGDRASEVDQADAESGRQTHVVYFVPKDRPDENLDESGAIGKSIASVREWFARETGRSGAARRPRIDRTSTGSFDITFVRGQKDAAAYDSLGPIARELAERGFAAENKRYLVYAAISAGNVCGQGYVPVPEVDPGRYSAVFLDSNASCGARDFGNGTVSGSGKADTVAAHEWLHNEGVVSPLAPHHCAIPIYVYHVCTGPLAVLPENPKTRDPEAPDIAFPFINAALKDKILDRDRDDYLDHTWPHLANLRDSPWFE